MDATDHALLIVDDDEVDRAAIARAVERSSLPYSLRFAGSLSEARDRLRDAVFDIVFADYKLGDGTGIELISVSGNAPVVVITGMGNEAVAAEAVRAGAYDYLIKDRRGRYLDLIELTVERVMARVRAEQAARKELEESEERFRQIAEHIDEVFWIRDAATGDLQYVSPAFEKIWGRSRSGPRPDAEAWFAAVHRDDQSRVRGFLAELARAECECEYRVVQPNGAVRWVRDRGFPIRRTDRVVGVVADVTVTKDKETALWAVAANLDELACHDPLTGLANRRGLERVMVRELERGRRGGHHVSGVLLDCDDFKAINDGFGHTAGDVVLREIGRRLERALRPTDCLARVGGDEFLALLPDTRRAEAERVAERLRLAVAESPLRIGTRSMTVTASLGVASVPLDAVSTEEVLQAVELALAKSKQLGKNRVTSESGADVAASVAEEIVVRMRHGRGFRVMRQSIRSLEDQSVVGWELLSRGPPGAFESPLDFFRVSIENNILTLVDLRCLKSCLSAARQGDRSSPSDYHVNLYPSTLLELAEARIEQLFCERPNGHGTFCVEISEQQFIGEPGYLRRPVALLKRIGTRVAIDDVGFGRSSLESLIVLEPDVIKIDRSFVHGAADDRGKRTCLERLLRVAGSLQADVVAEGLEREADVSLLCQLGVPYGQGFYWEQPLAFAG